MNVFEFIKEYWQILGALFGVIAMWIKMQGVDKDHEKRISKMEHDISKLDPVLLDIQTRLASIETSLKFLIDKK